MTSAARKSWQCILAIFSILCLPQNAIAQGFAKTCLFHVGPKKGTTHYFPYHPAAPIGAACNDGAYPYMSVGNVVADAAAAPPAPAGLGPAAAMANSCKFNSGIFAGTTLTYYYLPSAPVGVPCHDGLGGSGTVVADGPAIESQTCLYLSGMRKGLRQSFPNLQPVPLGLPCWDGADNFGVVVPNAGSSYQSSWDGSGSAANQPPPPGATPVPLPSASQAPLDVAKACMAAGGDETIMAACFVKNSPPDLANQCATNCSSCFGKYELNTLYCKAIGAALDKLKIKPQVITKPIDKALGTVKKWGKKFGL